MDQIVLYQSPNGKDYLLKLKHFSNNIIQVDLQSGFVSEYPFPSRADANANLRTWVENSIRRLPRKFCIDSSDPEEFRKVKPVLQKLGLEYPKDKDIRSKLVYVNGQYMVMDDFDNNNVPVLDLKFLRSIPKGGVQHA